MGEIWRYRDGMLGFLRKRLGEMIWLLFLSTGKEIDLLLVSGFGWVIVTIASTLPMNNS